MRCPLSMYAFRAIMLGGTVLLGACAAGQDYEKPALDLDKHWDVIGEKPPAGISLTKAKEMAARPWWEQFHDPALARLIAQARARNYDIQIAETRVSEARADFASSTAALLPEIDGSASGTRQRYDAATGKRMDTNKEIGFTGNWELDLFGGNQRRREAASAELQASEADRDQAYLNVMAEVATSYIEMRSAQMQRKIVERNLEMQRQTLRMTRDQRKAQAITDLEVARAEAEVGTTEARLPQIDIALNAAINRIAVLTDQKPAAVREQFSEPRPIPAVPAEVVVATPVEVMASRPDVHAAERRLEEATALSGAAFAQFFPKLTLSGFFGNRDSQLFGDAVPWSTALKGLVPLLDFGRVRSQVDIADARQKSAFFVYQQTVLKAVEEVENALVSYLSEQKRKETLTQVARHQARASEVAREQFKAGVTTHLDLLLTERDQANVENDVILSQAATAEHLIQLYRALGITAASPDIHETSPGEAGQASVPEPAAEEAAKAAGEADDETEDSEDEENAAPVHVEAARAESQAAAAAGNAMVQLGAYRSEDEARQEWEAMRQKQPALAGKEPAIIKADLGDKGIYYRLRVGGLSPAGARGLCRALKANGQDCILPKDK